jgi:hypothetical protein
MLWPIAPPEDWAGSGSVMGTLDEMRDLMELVAVTDIRPENGLELPMKRAESA